MNAPKHNYRALVYGGIKDSNLRKTMQVTGNKILKKILRDKERKKRKKKEIEDGEIIKYSVGKVQTASVEFGI